MEFPVKTGAAASQRAECAILPVFEDGQLRGATREIDTAARGIIKQLVRKGDISGRIGATTFDTCMALSVSSRECISSARPISGPIASRIDATNFPMASIWWLFNVMAYILVGSPIEFVLVWNASVP